MKNNKTIFISFSIAALAIASIALASHSWGAYHWARTSNPFTLKLGDNVSSAWDSTLTAASTDWSVSDVLDTSVVSGLSNPKNCKAVAGRVEVCNSRYGNNGWLGVAQIWITDSTHITQGTVKLNDTYFATPTYNTPAWRQMVACQEIGHTFGLDHQDENFNNLNLGTCMDYTNDPARNDGAGNNVHPNAHDYEELDTIYAHLDSFATILATAPATQHASDLAGADDGAWGTVLRRDSHGKPSLYGRDLGHGNKEFTFVYWAN